MNKRYNTGRYVRIRKSKGGTCRAYFIVPAAFRPEGWPSVISIPEIGQRSGRLDDARFRAKLESEAKRLNERLDERRRRLLLASSTEQTVARLAEIYYGRDIFKVLSATRQYRNKTNINKIIQWAEARGNPDVGSLSAFDVDDFLSTYNDRLHTRIAMRHAWNRLFNTAVYARWISQTPLEGGNWNTPTPAPTVVWTERDVQRYCEAARQLDQPGLAALINAGWLTGQRVGDLRAARWNHEYNGQRLLIKQSKTGVLVDLPVDTVVRRLLERVRRPGSDHLFVESGQGVPFTPTSLTYWFGQVRLAATKPGDPLLQLRALRHSCVCRLFEEGNNVAGIAAVTGHRLLRVHNILERYFPDRERLAEQAMRRSFELRGGQPDDFGPVDKPLPKDWLATKARKAFAYPVITTGNLDRVMRAVSINERLRDMEPEPAG
jgi:integrase